LYCIVYYKSVCVCVCCVCVCVCVCTVFFTVRQKGVWPP